MPMKRSGRSVDDASRVIEIDEVLVAMIASGFSEAHRSAKILRLTSSFSAADSMTMSQPAMASYFSAGAMRASAALRSSSLISFLPTWRVMLPLMVAMPALMRSLDTSLSSHRIARQRADMGDAVAHLPGADHPHTLNIQRHVLVRSMRRPGSCLRLRYLIRIAPCTFTTNRPAIPRADRLIRCIVNA